MELPQPLTRYRNAVEEELRSLLTEQALPLYCMMRYQLGWVDSACQPQETPSGKRIRPSLCLLACHALGGDVSRALPAAAAVELAHNFSLVHEDIQDGSPERRSRATVWWLWGPAQAINAGDGLHALARLSLLRLQERGHSADAALQAIQYLDDACLRLCEGQYMGLGYQERIDITEQQYFDMAEAKSGALMGCAMRLGALAATQNQALIDAFHTCGRKLGMAFQVRDDILDLWGAVGSSQASPAGDVLGKKRSLPVVYALEHGSIEEKRRLGALLIKRVMKPQDVQAAAQVLEGAGARDYAQSKAGELAREGVDILERQGISGSALEDLRVAADFLVHREY